MFALACAGITAAFILVYYFAYGKKAGVKPGEAGLAVSGKKLWKTVVIAVVTAAATYSLVFIADYFAKTDFRCWIITIKTFGSERFSEFFKFFPFFFAYCLVISISTNVFNYVKIGKNDNGSWNLVIQCIAAAIVPLFFLSLQYITFFTTGYTWTEMKLGMNGMPCIWIIAFPILVPFVVCLSRIIYKRTKNPYIGGIIGGIIFTLIQISGTVTAAV